MVSKTRIVEEHTGDHERPRERPAASFVGTGDVPHVERAIEPRSLAPLLLGRSFCDLLFSALDLRMIFGGLG